MLIQLTLVYAPVNSCTYTEYQEPLVNEIEENIAKYGIFDLGKLTLMDNFLRESARVNASESSMKSLLDLRDPLFARLTVSLRRKAMNPYVFKDGFHINEGD